MQAFFISLMISALENPKVQALLKQLFADAEKSLQDAVLARLDVYEKDVIALIEGLPAEILGDATKDVGVLLHEITGTKDDIAGAVKGEMQPLFQPLVSILQNLPGGGILGSIFGR